MRRRTLRVLCLSVAALLGACSGITPYRSATEKNFYIRAAMQNARASIDVYRVDSSCHAQYEGTVVLDTPRAEIGIPPDRLSLLVFNFTTSSWLGGNRRTMAREALFRPRTGRRYQIDLSYRNDIYDIVAREGEPGKRAGRELDLKSLDTCR